jgi:hypothetical protein
MRKLIQRIEAMLTAAAFAEEGEVETARRIAEEGSARAAALPRPGGGAVRRAPARRRRLQPVPLAKRFGA